MTDRMWGLGYRVKGANWEHWRTSTQQVTHMPRIQWRRDEKHLRGRKKHGFGRSAASIQIRKKVVADVCPSVCVFVCLCVCPLCFFVSRWGAM